MADLSVSRGLVNLTPRTSCISPVERLNPNPVRHFCSTSRFFYVEIILNKFNSQPIPTHHRLNPRNLNHEYEKPTTACNSC